MNPSNQSSNYSQPNLYERMKLDMSLAGFVDGTQRSYINAVQQLERHYDRQAEHLTERQLQEYALYLRNEKQVAKGTFQNYWSGLRFLYFITLDREWRLFTKKKSPTLGRNGCRRPRPTRNVVA